MAHTKAYLDEIERRNIEMDEAGELEMDDEEAIDIVMAKKPIRGHLALLGVMWMNKHINLERGCDEDGKPFKEKKKPNSSS